MWQTIRYRRLQAVTIALLAALVTASAVFAPLYDRATQQALTRIELDRASSFVRGVSVSAGASQRVDAPATNAPDVSLVVQSVPRRIRRLLGAPILGHVADGRGVADGGTSGLLQWRAGQCAHLAFPEGRCPTAAYEIAVSPVDARRFHLGVGSTLQMLGASPAGGRTPARAVTLSVVGLYRQRPGGYWFGEVLTGVSGQLQSGPPAAILHDAWVTAGATFRNPGLPPLADDRSEADFPLDPADVDVDRLLYLGPAVDRLDTRLGSDPAFAGSAYRLDSGVPGIAADVRHQRAQSHVTVPLLMAQLALLAVVVLWLVLGAATEQRRPEIAVAVLRGRGRGGARSLLLAELVPVTLAGVPVGVAAALGLSWLARDRLLPGSAPFEVGLQAVLATAVATLVLAGATLLAVLAVTRHGVERLLRRVPQRRSGWSLGVAEALLLAAAGTVVIAFVTGGLSGPVALLAPAVLALFIGALLSHATPPVATTLGRRLMRRGRVGPAISVLDAARTPATRRVVAIVTVSTSLLVFATTAVLVGSRNRALAAEQTAGAPVTVAVHGDDLGGIRAAVRASDPSGHHATPVVSVSQSGDGPETVAVEPAAFRRIALFAGRHNPPDLSALAPLSAPPIRLTGDTVSVAVTTQDLHSRQPASLELLLVGADQQVSTVDLGRLSGPGGQVTTAVPCTTGCELMGLSVATSPSATIRGTITLSGMSTSTGAQAPRTVSLGPTSAWQGLTGRLGTMTPTASGGDLSVAVATTGLDRTTLRQAWFPRTLPAIVTRGRPQVISGLDGVDRSVRVVGRVARVPASSADAALVDLDVLARGSQLEIAQPVQVWLDREDPALLRRLASALRARGMRLGTPTTLADVRRGYDESTASWSLSLGVVVSLVALLLGVLVVVVMAVTTWRSRSRDLAALRLAGVGRGTSRSVATLAQLPALLLAVVAGTACGVIGARLTLPTLPLLAHRAVVPVVDLSVPWLAVAATAAVALLLLTLAGWFAGTAIARRADLQRVRETV